jgi:hypothetical protein
LSGSGCEDTTSATSEMDHICDGPESEISAFSRNENETEKLERTRNTIKILISRIRIIDAVLECYGQAI